MAVPSRSHLIVLWLCALLLALLGSANGQSFAASSSQTSSAPAATHTVTVGVDGFTYNPTSLTANVGDTVLFIFYPQNHSVARAEYGYPCIPYENTGPGKVGFWSGFQAISAPEANGPKFALKINNTEPTFFYCSAVDACIPNGMIGVINPTLANQQLFVKNSTIQLSPGQENPPESSPSPTAAAASSSSSSGIGGGAIAGIVVGCIVLIALAGFAFYLCGRNRTLASVLRYSQPPRRPNAIPPVPYTPSMTNSPYSPEFSAKPGLSPASRGGGGGGGGGVVNPHESWQTQGTAVRPTSPEMAATMSPPHFGQGYGSGGYNAVENPGNNPAAYRGIPGETPWSPGGFHQVQYAQVPQNHEMPAGHDQPSPGMSSPGLQSLASHTSLQPTQPTPTQDGPHELDARSSAPETPGAAPPRYAARAFSFSAGTDAPPGVEKVLRD